MNDHATLIMMLTRFGVAHAVRPEDGAKFTIMANVDAYVLVSQHEGMGDQRFLSGPYSRTEAASVMLDRQPVERWFPGLWQEDSDTTANGYSQLSASWLGITSGIFSNLAEHAKRLAELVDLADLPSKDTLVATRVARTALLVEVDRLNDAFTEAKKQL